MITTRSITDQSFSKNISKFEIDFSYDIARELFRGNDTKSVYVGRESYFKNYYLKNTYITEWSQLKDLFDIVNTRVINMDNIETTISEPALDKSKSIWEMITPFHRFSKYVR